MRQRLLAAGIVACTAIGAIGGATFLATDATAAPMPATSTTYAVADGSLQVTGLGMGDGGLLVTTLFTPTPGTMPTGGTMTDPADGTMTGMAAQAMGDSMSDPGSAGISVGPDPMGTALPVITTTWPANAVNLPIVIGQSGRTGSNFRLVTQPLEEMVEGYDVSVPSLSISIIAPGSMGQSALGSLMNAGGSLHTAYLTLQNPLVTQGLLALLGPEHSMHVQMIYDDAVSIVDGLIHFVDTTVPPRLVITS